MKTILCSAGLFFFYLFLPFMSFGQDIPDEARRHLVRGQTAVEIAKLPSDYDLAVTEFKQAIELAPLWAEPLYQLARVYEKTEKFTEAIACLNKYLELAPDATNAGEVKDLIYKLEFKAEQVLTVSDYIDMLCAGFLGWSQSGDELYWPYFFFAKFEKTGPNTIQIFDDTRNNFGTLFTYVNETLTITGPTISFISKIDQCYPDPCLIYIDNRIEIVSRTHIIYKQTLTPVLPNSMTSSQEKRSAEYKKDK